MATKKQNKKYIRKLQRSRIKQADRVRNYDSGIAKTTSRQLARRWGPQS